MPEKASIQRGESPSEAGGDVSPSWKETRRSGRGELTEARDSDAGIYRHEAPTTIEAEPNKASRTTPGSDRGAPGAGCRGAAMNPRRAGSAGKRRATRAGKGDGNKDLVIYLLTVLSVLVLTAIVLFMLRSRESLQQDDRKVIAKVKDLLATASGDATKWNQAERAGDEAGRAKRDAFNDVIDTVDTLRRDPYVLPESEDMEFKRDYQYLEQFSRSAGQALSDISKRAHSDDF
jgi:hypothetical protein